MINNYCTTEFQFIFNENVCDTFILKNWCVLNKKNPSFLKDLELIFDLQNLGGN